MRRDRAFDIVKRWIIEPVMNKGEAYVGAEVELPVIRVEGDEDLKLTGCGLLTKLAEEEGFEEGVRGADGSLVRVQNQRGDGVSYDYHYAMLELSMARSRSLSEMSDRFDRLVKAAGGHLKEHGFLLTGMGSNPTSVYPNFQYTQDSFYRLIRGYVREQTSYKDPARYFTNMHSTQTHVDVPKGALLECYNLFNGLEFVRGILFANSVPVEGTLPEGMRFPDGTACARDYIWQHCELPNTGGVDREFWDSDQLAEYLAGQEIFVKSGDGRLSWMEPVTLRRYFEDSSHEETAIRYYRSFQNVVLNRYHALEVRSDCTQPFGETFAPCAFSLGLAYASGQALKLLEDFKKSCRLEQTDSELRAMAVCGQRITGDGEMQAFLKELLDLAEEGLVKRGLGEERHLAAARERAARLVSPGRESLELLKEGRAALEIARLYSEKREGWL